MRFAFMVIVQKKLGNSSLPCKILKREIMSGSVNVFIGWGLCTGIAGLRVFSSWKLPLSQGSTLLMVEGKWVGRTRVFNTVCGTRKNWIPTEILIPAFFSFSVWKLNWIDAFFLKQAHKMGFMHTPWGQRQYKSKP